MHEPTTHRGIRLTVEVNPNSVSQNLVNVPEQALGMFIFSKLSVYRLENKQRPSATITPTLSGPEIAPDFFRVTHRRPQRSAFTLFSSMGLIRALRPHSPQKSAIESDGLHTNAARRALVRRRNPRSCFKAWLSVANQIALCVTPVVTPDKFSASSEM